MENLIKKLKKAVRENEDLNKDSDLDFKKLTIDNNNNQDNLFSTNINSNFSPDNNTEKNNTIAKKDPKQYIDYESPFTVSEMCRSRSHSKKRKALNKSLSCSLKESQDNKIDLKSSQSSLKGSYLEQGDPITKSISKALNYIKKNKDKIDLEVIVDHLNEILDLHINSLSNQRISNAKSSEKDIIMQTKYETAEKMSKNFELKFLTSEKERNKILKNYEELQNKYNQLKEQKQYNLQQSEDIVRLQKNNYVLIQTNEDLKKNIQEINLKNDFMKKKYEEELEQLKNLFKQYHTELNKIEKTIFNNSKIEDPTLTLNSIN